jgi:anaerobic magnesium-protoporphyrin IX monomethyl ester cyclase
MGLEGTDEATLATVQKGGTRAKDRQAIRLLRQHGMIGLCTFAVGFEEETDADYWRLLRQLLAYDPDQVMSIYATPHRWTPFHAQSAHRRVIRTDLRFWDYKHQVLETPGQRDPDLRHAMRWYTRMGRGVWRHEWRDFLTLRTAPGPTVAALSDGDTIEENALLPLRRRAS